ncbi:MAG: circadian clock KaiB family protein [Steroidobacteraceae bacterium]
MKHVQVVTFRLYITGNAPNSLLARANLADLCGNTSLIANHVEVIDLLQDPHRALSDGVYMTPTLVKLAPLPEARFVGSLTDLAPIVASLGLKLG